MLNVDGKRVLVTGASRGIGQACVWRLMRNGAHVVASDVLDCDETVNGASGGAGSVIQYPCDVSDERSVVELFNRNYRTDQPLDYLVHCAGVIHEKPLLDTTAAEFDRVINVNLRGSFLVGREALRLMSAQGHGRVTMIASDLAYYGRETFCSYVASKHGVLGLVRCWAHEFAPAINVNAICPGPIDTKMLGAENMSEEWRQKELDIPARRFGQPDEIAHMALFLLSSGADYITGQGLGVNGGSVMV